MPITKKIFKVTGITEDDYREWCKTYKKSIHKPENRTEFFQKVLDGRIIRDTTTGKLVNKRKTKKWGEPMKMNTMKKYNLKIYVKRMIKPIVIVINDRSIFDALHEEAINFPFIKISDISINTKLIKYFILEEVKHDWCF